MLTQLPLPASKSQCSVPCSLQEGVSRAGLWNMDKFRDPDYRAQSGGNRVQEEERTSQILAFIDGFKTIMLPLSNRTENCMSHSWVFVNVTEGRKLPKGRETRILTAAKGEIFQ